MVVSRPKSSTIPDLSIGEIVTYNNNSQIEKIGNKIIELKKSIEELKEGLEEGKTYFYILGSGGAGRRNYTCSS